MRDKLLALLIVVFWASFIHASASDFSHKTSTQNISEYPCVDGFPLMDIAGLTLQWALGIERQSGLSEYSVMIEQSLCGNKITEASADMATVKPQVAVAASQAKFRILALVEEKGNHLAFTEAAKPWLKQCGEENGFEVDYFTNTVLINESFLSNYRVVLQLDFVPYGWKPEAMAAFKAYVEQGKGGWVGLHHATLLGDFDGYPMWTWFHEFMGKIKFKNYIPKFASGKVQVEDNAHPCMKNIAQTFVVSREEWYTYDRSPRPNVHVLATVDESTYSPDSAIKMGDHPVIWTNEKVAARNLYIFMGHGPDLIDNKAFTTLLRNAVLWAAGK